MQKQIGLAFLGALSLLFGSYGVWALTLAYHAEPLNEWGGKAGLVPAAWRYASCSRVAAISLFAGSCIRRAEAATAWAGAAAAQLIRGELR